MTDLRFDGDVAAITGAGGSIGGAYARALASRGARIVVADAPTPEGHEKAERVVADIKGAGGEAVAVNVDAVTEPAAIIAAALDTWQQLDIVISNAGASAGGLISDVPIAEFERAAEVNYYGATRLLHHAWPHLRISGGRVLLTSSGSVFGVRYTSPYASSKAALLALGRILAMDGEADGIRVNSVLPISSGGMMTDFPNSDDFNAMIREHYTPESVASVGVWLLHKDTPVSGQAYVSGGGFAGRVTLAMNFGWGQTGATPEDYRKHEDAVTSFGKGVFIPHDAGDDVNFRSDRAFGWHADSPFLH